MDGLSFQPRKPINYRPRKPVAAPQAPAAPAAGATTAPTQSVAQPRTTVAERR